MSSEARNEFVTESTTIASEKIREAVAAAIGQLDQLRSTELTPGETFGAEVARIAQEKLHPYGCDLGC